MSLTVEKVWGCVVVLTTLAPLWVRPSIDWYLSVIFVERIASSSDKLEGSPDDLFADLLAILQHLPRNEKLYLLSCDYFRQVQQPQRCSKLLELGMRAVPESWLLPLQWSMVLQHHLDDAPSALPYLARAARHPHAPVYVAGALAKLRQKL